MATHDQTSRRTDAQKAAIENLANQCYIGNILSIDPSGEQAKVDMGANGVDDLPFPHPFLSDTSWIRAVPDGSTGKVLLQQMGDTGQPAILRYYSAQAIQTAQAYDGIAAELRQDPTNKDTASKATTVRRTLRPGEQDAVSSGLAGIYKSDKGTLEIRGGVVVHELVGPDGESLCRAPLHRRTTLLFQHGADMKDQERFGVVKRPDSDKAAFREIPILVDNPSGFTPPPAGGVAGAVGAALGAILPQSAAKEWFLDIGYDGLPDRLYRHRVGQVFDEDASSQSDQLKSADTGGKLRAKYEWFTAPLGNALELDVDELGNVVLQFPDEAITGLIARTKLGSFNLTMLNLILNTILNATVSATGQMTLSGMAGVEVSTVAEMDLIADLLMSINSQLGIEVVSPVVALGETVTEAAANFPRQGVVTGEDTDPMSGLPLWMLGKGSTTVVAKH